MEELNKSITALGKLKATEKSEISLAISNIEQQYSALDEDYKEQATMYKKLDSYITQCVKKTVKSLTKSNTFTAELILKDYKDYLIRSDILQLLGEIGLQRCVDDAISDLNRINSGKVYNITSVNAFCADDMGRKTSYKNGENFIEGELSISGTNYFGGPYNQEINLYYAFTIDVENCSISGVGGITY